MEPKLIFENQSLECYQAQRGSSIFLSPHLKLNLNNFEFRHLELTLTTLLICIYKFFLNQALSVMCVPTAAVDKQ